MLDMGIPFWVCVYTKMCLLELFERRCVFKAHTRSLRIPTCCHQSALTQACVLPAASGDGLISWSSAG